MSKTIKALTIVSTLAFAPVLLAAPPQADVERRQTNIPAQELESALQTFARERSMQIIFRSTLVKNLKSRQLSGALTPNEALDRLLGGTGLAYRYLDDRTVTIYPSGQASPNLSSKQLKGNSAVLVQYLAENGLTLVSAGPAPERIRVAQTKVEPPPTSSGQKEEVVEVTSTRLDGLRNKGILRTDAEAPIYYNVIERETIERLGITNVEELFRFLPQTSTPETSLQSAPNSINVVGGTSPNPSRISLRGFSSSQTLILINGRPLPRTSRVSSGGADIGGVPLASIERVEIIPASASAIYGASAIGGAVNFITRKDYQGGTLDLSVRTTEHGGGDRQSATYTQGFNFNDGRSRLTTTLEYSHRASLWARQRDYLQRMADRYPRNTTVVSGGRSAYEAFVMPSMAGPQATLLLGNSPPAGVTDLGIPGAPGVRYATVPLGTSAAASLALTPSSFTSTAGVAGQGLRYGDIAIYTPEEAFNLNLVFNHDFSDKLSAYAEFSGNRKEADYVQQQPGSTISLTATDPLNPFRDRPGFTGRPVLVYFHPADLPASSVVSKPTNARMTLGLQGRFARSWNWTVDVTGDRNETDYFNNNATNLFGSLQSGTPITIQNANGTLTAQGTRLRAIHGPTYGVPGTTPGTIVDDPSVRRAFYPLLADHAAYPFTGDMGAWQSLRNNNQKTVQVESTARLSGAILDLPAGEWVVGGMADYTEYSFSGGQQTGAGQAMVALIGAAPLGTFSSSEQGRSEKMIAFETAIPIIGKDFRPIPIEGLELNFSVSKERTHSNGDYIANAAIQTDNTVEATSRVGAIKLQLIKDLAVRASFTEGFYPPDWDDVTQPIDLQLQTPSTGTVWQDPLRGNTIQTQQFNIINGGNPDLRPERSESVNVGLIIKPRWIPGLTVNTDFWRTRKIDGISRTFFGGVPTVLQYPTLFTRGANLPNDPPGYAGIITGYDQRAINLSLIETDGVDTQIRYDLDMGEAGSFYVYTNASFTNSFRSLVAPGTPPRNTAGGSGPRRWRGFTTVTWERGPLGISLTGNYVGRRSTNTTTPSFSFPTANGLDGFRLAAVKRFDVQFTYKTEADSNASGLRGLMSDVLYRLHIDNILDKAPDLVSDGGAFYNRDGDPYQRTVTLSLNKRF